MNLNKALLIGRLTKDPEGRTTPAGKSVTSFSMATNKFWTDQSGNKQEATEYHNIVVWGKLAEIAAQYLVKGQEVYVEGRIQTRSWDAQDGTKKYTTEIVADNIQMGAKAGGGRGGNYDSQNYSSAPAAPQQNPAPHQEPDFGQPSVDASSPRFGEAGDFSPMQSSGDNQEIKIENIPF